MRISLIGAVLASAAAVTIAGCTSTATKTVAGPTVTRTTTATATVTTTATPTVVKTIATKTRTVRVTYTPPPPKAYGDGTYVVGIDIKPGTYHADAGQGYCAWFTARDKSGTDLIDSGNTSGNGPLTVVINSSIGSVIFQGDCTFHRR